MNFNNRAIRILAGIIGAAGLAYPACAAVCPKGKGGCPYPGKCFLFTDADANSVCDYTRSASPGSGTGQTPATTTSPSVSALVSGSGSPGTTAVSSSLDAGLAGTIQHFAPVIGVLLFALLCVILYRTFRSGKAGSDLKESGPALALSAWISLGISGIAAYLLMGETGSGMGSIFGVIYLLGGSILAAYLWHHGVVSRKIVLVISAMSTIFGFVLSVLIMPAEFAAILGLALGTQVVSFGALAILLILVLAFLTGRTFCAHICPVGSVQELASCVPVKKVMVPGPRTLEGIRILVFIAAILAALYSIDLIGLFGAYDFFTFTVSIWSVIFLIILALATMVYRPVCRAICPFGLLFAAAAQFGRYRLERTGDCTRCKKCEKVCPAGCAGENDSRRECYLCGRCSEACPAAAIVYRSRNFRT
ncbi:MAG TPA: 4Fe-4S binding protein [Methanoregulaceae archaeon]|nr:4Fe-4S binding protein [Methanoregulaceae archaeon]